MKIKDIQYKLIVTAIVIAVVLSLHTFDVPCVLLSISGFKCPGCGLTRALFSALRLNFKEAFELHKMFWSVPVLYWAFLKDGKVFKSKAANILLCSLLAVGFALNVAFC